MAVLDTQLDQLRGELATINARLAGLKLQYDELQARKADVQQQIQQILRFQAYVAANP